MLCNVLTAVNNAGRWHSTSSDIWCARRAGGRVGGCGGGVGGLRRNEHPEVGVVIDGAGVGWRCEEASTKWRDVAKAFNRVVTSCDFEPE